jgi:GGDEF domain-containing protein
VVETRDSDRVTWLNRRYTKNPDMVSRLIGEEFILVPIRRNVADLESVFTLGGTGIRIWELIDGRSTVRQILERVTEEFEVEPEEAEADLQEYLQALEEMQGVRLVEDA